MAAGRNEAAVPLVIARRIENCPRTAEQSCHSLWRQNIPHQIYLLVYMNYTLEIYYYTDLDHACFQKFLSPLLEVYSNQGLEFLVF